MEKNKASGSEELVSDPSSSPSCWEELGHSPLFVIWWVGDAGPTGYAFPTRDICRLTPEPFQRQWNGDDQLLQSEPALERV